MAFTKMQITNDGVNLSTKLIHGGQLEITRVIGCNGQDQGIPLEDYETVGNQIIKMDTWRGVEYNRSVDPAQLTIPLYWKNDQQSQEEKMNEIAIFARDPIKGEILFAISTSYGDPMSLIPLSDGLLELTLTAIIQVSLNASTTIKLPSSMIFLTRAEADILYAYKYHTHDTNEILNDRDRDGNIVTLEVAQADQWDAINELLAGKNVKEAITRRVDTSEPLKWAIINWWGYYDRNEKAFIA